VPGVFCTPERNAGRNGGHRCALLIFANGARQLTADNCPCRSGFGIAAVVELEADALT
jgi:hypothetical protein